MRTGLIRRVISLCAVLALALMTAPTVAAADDAPPIVTATVSSQNVVEPDAVTASATFIDLDSSGGYTCQIDWGDGTIAAGTVTDNSCTAPAHHFSMSASYVVFVEITDAGGATGNGLAQVNYTNVAPVLVAPYFEGHSVSSSSSRAEATIVDAGAPETYSCSVDYGDGSGVQPGIYLPSGGQSNQPRCRYPDHGYAAAGTYTIVMTVTDSGGATGTTTLTETILPLPPVVAWPLPSQTVHRSGATWHVDETAAFTDPGGDALGPWTWTVSWGEGNDSSGTATTQGELSFAHDYAKAGTYGPVIQVQNRLGAIGYGGFTVTALDEGPVVVANTQGTPSVYEGQAATYYWSATDASHALPFSVHVDWGDGSVSDFIDQTGYYALTHTYVASSPFQGNHGTYYTSTMTVTDALGLTASASQTVYVNDVAPVVTAPAAISVPEGNAPVTVTLGSFTDASVGPWQIVVTPDSTLYFKPTAWMAQTPSALQITWDPRWPSTNLYLEVVDRSGMMGGATIHISTANTAPSITSVTVTPNPQVEGTPVSVVTTFSDPGLGTAEQYTCTVDYGDGRYTGGTASGNTCTSSGHLYRSPGTYTAKVTLSDWNGGTATASAIVTVLNQPPAIVVFVPGQVAVGSATSFSAQFTDPGQASLAETYSCTMDYGDGTGPQAGAITGALCVGPNHVYTHAGTYAATVSVVDSNGGAGGATGQVTVLNSAPVVTATVSNDNPREPETVVASATFTDPESATETYSCAVDYGDGTVASGVVSGLACTGPQHQYRISGSYTVTVTVTDGSGRQGSGAADVYYTNTAPWQGGFGLDGDTRFGSKAHAVVAVVDPGQDFETYTCTVDYGDGSPILAGTWVPTGWGDDLPRCVFPDHVFPATGTYTMTTVVTDSGGASSSLQWQDSILPAIPYVQSFSIPSSVPEGSTVAASAVFLPTALNETYTCTVDYGDGAGPLAGVISGAACLGPKHAYGVPHGYFVTMAITSSGGLSSSWTAMLSVTNVTPTVSPKSVPSTATAGAGYAASISFADPGWAFGETYTCLIDYGDGDVRSGTISGQVCQGAQHSYGWKGTYQFVATVTDQYGAVGSYSQTITVYNARPVVASVAAPDSVFGGTAFKASAEFVATGRTETYTCTVDYGDGTGAQAATVTGTSCQGPSHTYKKLGTFTISVTVKGSVTGSGSGSMVIGVSPPPIAVGSVSVTGSPVEGASVTATAGFTPTGLTETYRCTVDYGDDLGAQAGTISGIACIGPKHKLGRGGSAIVTVSIYGSAGTYGSSSKSVNVTNVAPVFTKVTIPSTAKIGTAVSVSATFTDPGTSETYQAVLTWGDGTTTSILLAANTRSFTANHTYSTVGLHYPYVQLGDSADTINYDSKLAVYDPARTVAGSGTFPSWAGSCTLSTKCATASTGSFSLAASYAKGATKPTVSFGFTVNGLAFAASGADWLIAVNGTAEIQGTGTVNGVSGYKFGIVATDANPDTLTIAIQDSKGKVVYSNTGALKTGSITIK